VVEETQPNYTTMQRPDVLRGNDEILKSLTMFSTQRMQNFNIMYDAIATAHRYKIDFNNHVNGVTAEDVKQANKTRNAAITSQVASSVILGVMKTLAALLLLKWKNFGDDENKITKEGVAKQLLKENSNSFVGNFMFGSNLYEALEAIIFKDEFYGISLTGFDSITDFMESVVDYSQKAVHGELGFNSESGTDTLNLAKKFGTVFGAPVAQGYNLCNAISGWSQFAYAKITGENPSLSDYAQTVEIKQNNMVRKYLSDNDMDSINGLIDDKIKELKEKYPSYSDKKLKQKAQSSIRGSVTTVLKEEYLAADETEKKNIIEKMKNTGLYTKTSGKKTKDDSKDTAVEWEVSELKEQYLAAEDKETRKEIRKNLYATGKWKKLSELDKQLKKWLK
jgi:hypothetical protein